MKKIIALCLILAICTSTYAAKPRRPRKKSCDCARSVKREDKEKKVATVFLVSIGLVVMWAIQDGNENREKK